MRGWSVEGPKPSVLTLHSLDPLDPEGLGSFEGLKHHGNQPPPRSTGSDSGSQIRADVGQLR